MRSKLASRLFLLALALVACCGCSTVPKAEEQEIFLDKAKSTTRWFESSVTGLSGQINRSAGYIIFPDVSQWGILIGGGTFGRGALCKPDGTQIGWAALNTGSIGLQAGIQGFRMIMVIQDKDTLYQFMANQWSGSATGVLVAAEEGSSTTEPFQNGVVLYQGANSGLMAGVNVGLNYIRYEPLGSTEVARDIRQVH